MSTLGVGRGENEDNLAYRNYYVPLLPSASALKPGICSFAQILISPQSEEHVVIESPLGWNTDSMYSVVFQALLAEPSHSHTPGDVSSHRPSKASVTPFSPEII